MIFNLIHVHNLEIYSTKIRFNKFGKDNRVFLSYPFPLSILSLYYSLSIFSFSILFLSSHILFLYFLSIIFLSSHILSFSLISYPVPVPVPVLPGGPNVNKSRVSLCEKYRDEDPLSVTTRTPSLNTYNTRINININISININANIEININTDINNDININVNIKIIVQTNIEIIIHIKI